jgi:hypothetical protein
MEMLAMMDMVVIWDGDVKQPHRGHLAFKPDVTRPAPPLPVVPERGPISQHNKAWIANAFRAVMGERSWTVKQLVAETGFSESGVQLVLRKLVRDGRMLYAGPVDPENRGKGPTASRYRWAA